MKSNIVLIGMPGVGKSTLGVILAKTLGYEFLDTDLVIQHTEQRLLKEIIEAEGPDGFIEREAQIVSGISVSHTVIATGGSIVYGKAAMRHLAEEGIIVYLKQDLPVIQKRLHNINNRGVVLKEGQTFEDLYYERCVLYEKYADIIIEQKDLDVETCLERVIEALQYLRQFMS